MIMFKTLILPLYKKIKLDQIFSHQIFFIFFSRKRGSSCTSRFFYFFPFLFRSFPLTMFFFTIVVSTNMNMLMAIGRSFDGQLVGWSLTQTFDNPHGAPNRVCKKFRTWSFLENHTKNESHELKSEREYLSW